MRHSNAGPTNNKASPAPTSSLSPQVNGSNGVQGVVKVYASDLDTFPLAQFEAHSSVHHILKTLKLQNGGLKVKGSSDTFKSDESKLEAGDYVVIGSGGLRLRVVWKGNKLIVPYPFPSHQVLQLQEEVASRFARFHSGDKELKMAEIRTLDGYLINRYDRIMEAIHDGDVVEAIDFETWLKEQAKLCSETWLELTQADFADDTSKWATVGKHSHGKLFVQTGHGKTVDRLELFELEDLKVFAKQGQHQILTYKGQQDSLSWFTNASFDVNVAGLVTAVRLEVKSLSDPRPIVKEIKVKIENNQLIAGDIQLIQSAEDPEDESLPKPLPPSKREEKEIVDPPAAPEVKFANIQAFQKLKIEQIDPVFADQTWASNGEYNNNFYLNFSFTNPGESVVTVAKVKTEYELSENNWVAAKRTAIGYKAGFYDYRWNWNTSNFSLDKHAIDKIAVLCSIPIQGPQVDRLRRAHHSLPYPLKIRTTFEDDQGATSFIDTVYYNGPHKLPTKESVEKSNSKTYDFWAQLDDVETETRHYIAIARVKDSDNSEYLDIKVSPGSSTYYFYKTNLSKLAFEAVKNGKDEIEIDQLKVEGSNGVEAHAHALVNVEKKRVYAIRWTLKTASASMEECYVVKPLAGKS